MDSESVKTDDMKPENKFRHRVLLDFKILRNKNIIRDASKSIYENIKIIWLCAT